MIILKDWVEYSLSFFFLIKSEQSIDCHPIITQNNVILYLPHLSQCNINNQRNTFQKVYFHIQLLICIIQHCCFGAEGSQENV